MNLKRLSLVAFLAVAALALAAQDAKLLRRELKEGTTEVYKIETKTKQTMTVPGAGEQDLEITNLSTYKLTLGKVAGDPAMAEIETETIVDKMEAGGAMAQMMPPMGQVPPVKTKGKIDARNRMKLEAAKAGTMNMMAMMGGGAGQQNMGLFIEFPEAAVKIGDTWDVLVPKSPFTGKEDQKLTAKLVGEKEVDGMKVWVVSTTGTINTSIDMAELMKSVPADQQGPMGAMKMMITGKIKMTGEALVDPTTGKMLSSSTKAETNQTVAIEDAGMSIDSVGTVVTTVKLQK